jgi:hypothetical protein
MQIVRKICKVLNPKNVKLTSIDGTGFDAWQRSRHYEKRAGENHKTLLLPHHKVRKKFSSCNFITIPQITQELNFLVCLCVLRLQK